MYGDLVLSHCCRQPQDVAALHWSRHHILALHWSLLCRLVARLGIIMWHLLVTIATSTDMEIQEPTLGPEVCFAAFGLGGSDRSMRATLLRVMLLMLHAACCLELFRDGEGHLNLQRFRPQHPKSSTQNAIQEC